MTLLAECTPNLRALPTDDPSETVTESLCSQHPATAGRCQHATADGLRTRCGRDTIFSRQTGQTASAVPTTHGKRRIRQLHCSSLFLTDFKAERELVPTCGTAGYATSRSAHKHCLELTADREVCSRVGRGCSRLATGLSPLQLLSTPVARPSAAAPPARRSKPQLTQKVAGVQDAKGTVRNFFLEAYFGLREV